jgi:hypothetical protein
LVFRIKDLSIKLDELRDDETKIKTDYLVENYDSIKKLFLLTAKRWIGIAAVIVLQVIVKTERNKIYIDSAREYKAAPEQDKKMVRVIALKHNTV